MGSLLLVSLLFAASAHGQTFIDLSVITGPGTFNTTTNGITTTMVVTDGGALTSYDSSTAAQTHLGVTQATGGAIDIQFTFTDATSAAYFFNPGELKFWFEDIETSTTAGTDAPQSSEFVSFSGTTWGNFTFEGDSQFGGGFGGGFASAPSANDTLWNQSSQYAVGTLGPVNTDEPTFSVSNSVATSGFGVSFGNNTTSAGRDTKYVHDVALSINPVPEPSSFALLGLSAMSVLLRRKRS